MSANTYRVLITEPVKPSGIHLLKEQGYQIVMGTGYDEETLIREAADVDAVLTRNGIFSRRVLEACKKLKVVSMHGVGVDRIDVKAADELGIQVTHVTDGNTVSVAEFTIAMLLALAKKLPQNEKDLRNGNWNSRFSYTGCDIAGKTLGILGMGKIGTDVARKACFGFDMKVLGYKRGLAEDVTAEYGALTSDLDRVIASADYLSIHLPLNDGTFHLITAEKLALMKDSASILNLGRGSIIDETALVEALQSGHLAGAALDVFEGEVPKADHPLLHMDQVIATTHVAGLSNEARDRLSYGAAKGIVETLEGMDITCPVNHPQKWNKGSVA